MAEETLYLWSASSIQVCNRKLNFILCKAEGSLGRAPARNCADLRLSGRPRPAAPRQRGDGPARGLGAAWASTRGPVAQRPRVDCGRPVRTAAAPALRKLCRAAAADGAAGRPRSESAAGSAAHGADRARGTSGAWAGSDQSHQPAVLALPCADRPQRRKRHAVAARRRTAGRARARSVLFN